MLPDTHDGNGDGEFQSRMRDLDTLLQEVDAISNPADRARTGQIIHGLMAFHGAALGNLTHRLAGSGVSVEELAGDELVSSMLLLYGLHPQDLATRVRAALDSVRPYLASHGGSVQLLGVSDDGTVRLAMQESCHGCPSSAATMQTNIERAIYDRAPDVTAIHVDTDAAAPATQAPAGFVPVEQLVARAAQLAVSAEGATA